MQSFQRKQLTHKEPSMGDGDTRFDPIDFPPTPFDVVSGYVVEKDRDNGL